MLENKNKRKKNVCHRCGLGGRWALKHKGTEVDTGEGMGTLTLWYQNSITSNFASPGDSIKVKKNPVFISLINWNTFYWDCFWGEMIIYLTTLFSSYSLLWWCKIVNLFTGVYNAPWHFSWRFLKDNFKSSQQTISLFRCVVRGCIPLQR